MNAQTNEILLALKRALKEIYKLNEHRNETPQRFIEYIEKTIANAN